MQTNWSLILNVLLLMGVVITIGRMMKARRKNLSPAYGKPSLERVDEPYFDDIIAVRKVNYEADEEIEDLVLKTINKAEKTEQTPIEESQQFSSYEKSNTLMVFLLAKENRQLAGYELLQTVLAAGLRFGEGNLFHRHQHSNGQGPIMCSLAAATASGTFDLQNIGAFKVRGLCLFMQTSENPAIDTERFSILLETAKHLRDGLDTYLLDDNKQPLSEESLMRYRNLLISSEF